MTSVPDYTGTWTSTYAYFSTSRNATLTSEHGVTIDQDGDRLAIDSFPWEPSVLSLSLAVDGRILTGTWSEVTDPEGHYAGARFHGAVQFMADPAGSVMTGRWVGFGRDETIKTSMWSLTRAD